MKLMASDDDNDNMIIFSERLPYYPSINDYHSSMVISTLVSLGR